MGNRLDPVKYEILYQRMHNVLMEGKEMVRRLCCSPIVREAGEVLEAFLLPEGDLVLMSTGLLTHVNGMINGIRYMRENHYERDIGIYDGDQFINNDAMIGGIHRNDFINLAPVFYKENLIGWVGNLGHVFELGAIEPGGMCPKAEEAYHEGIVLPLVKIIERGHLKRDILNMMVRHVRDPRPIEIDTRARIAGNELTKARILELVNDFGLDFFLAAARQFIEDSADEARKIIQSRRPGIYKGRCFSDNRTPYKMGLRMVEARLEFTEEGNLNLRAPVISPQERGFGNCALPGIIGYTLCTLLEHLFYLARWNGGIMHSVSIDIPPQSMLHVDETGAVGVCSTLTGQIWQVAVTDALSRAAFAGGAKKDVLGSCGIVNVVFVAGIDQFGRRGGNVVGDWAMIGGGAKVDRDGADSGVVQVNPHNLGPDTESDETMFASITLAKKHLKDSGGFGKYRGGTAGQGITAFSNTPFFMSSHLGYGKYVTCGQGLFGGYPPPGTRHISLKGTNILEKIRKSGSYPTTLEEMENWTEGQVQEEPHLAFMRPIDEGDLLGTSYWGGGGLGDPLERDPELIIQDIRKELTSIDTARRVYCVSINDKTLSINLEETQRLRAAKKEERLKNGVSAYKYLKETVEKREKRNLTKPVLDFFDRMSVFSPAFVADLEKEKGMVKRGWLLTQIKVTEPKKDLFELTPYVKVVEDKEGKKITQCSQCGHTYGLATENFMIGCLIYDRDPKDIQPPNLAPDKDWMVYREFYCPGCGIQVEVEAVPPGMTILNKIELKL